MRLNGGVNGSSLDDSKDFVVLENIFHAIAKVQIGAIGVLRLLNCEEPGMEALLAREAEHCRDNLRFAWINGFKSFDYFVAKLPQCKIGKSKEMCFNDGELPQWHSIQIVGVLWWIDLYS
jgi:hypothetical protein